MKKYFLIAFMCLLTACGNNNSIQGLSKIEKVILAECIGIINNKQEFKVVISAYTLDNSYVLEHWYNNQYFINYVAPEITKEFLGFYISEYTLVVRNLTALFASDTKTGQGVIVTGNCVNLR